MPFLAFFHIINDIIQVSVINAQNMAENKIKMKKVETVKKINDDYLELD